ncbi:Gfo/Idh/MocA family oxidoreductase [Halomarina salina]|uniref:Gfo/Idh/MocA family oxidoreductase n=1 Tax=Halomarina salina TaxID=1872699 RepID=A0ABD5RIJ9_9EURY|nr:Gfo/Idh/MocA family oxidoreductase [Halomarina salina]
MTETTRTGVIGVGYMGWNHARQYSELPNVDLVGVADRDQKRAVQTAREFDTEARSVEGLLDSVDAVSIAVPTQHHADLIDDCFDAGVHVLVEKPFVDDLDRGRALVERSEATGLTLQVGHVERFNPAVQTLADIASHLDVIAFSTRRVGPGVDRQLTDSVALDLMIHDIDIVLSMVDAPLDDLTSVSTANGQHATAALRFEDGVVADMTASRVTQREERTIEVVTESGCLLADCIDQSVEVHRTSSGLQESMNGHRLYQCDGVVERPSVQQADPLRRELESFVETVAAGTLPLVDGTDGLRAVELAQRVERAALVEALAEEVSG